MSKAIIIHSDMRAGLKLLGHERAGELLLALCALADGETPEITDAALMPFWGVMRSQQQEYWKRYEKTCKLRRENGLKGGLAKASKCQQKLPKASKSWQKPYDKDQDQDQDQDQGSQRDGTGRGPVQDDLLKLEGQTSGISFDSVSGKIEGLPGELLERWQTAYPLVDVAGEVERAGMWLTENPRRRKKDFVKFVGNWLRTAAADAAAGRGAGGGGRRPDGRGQRAEEHEVRVHEGGLMV